MYVLAEFIVYIIYIFIFVFYICLYNTINHVLEHVRKVLLSTRLQVLQSSRLALWMGARQFEWH